MVKKMFEHLVPWADSSRCLAKEVSVWIRKLVNVVPSFGIREKHTLFFTLEPLPTVSQQFSYKNDLCVKTELWAEVATRLHKAYSPFKNQIPTLPHHASVRNRKGAIRFSVIYQDFSALAASHSLIIPNSFLHLLNGQGVYRGCLTSLTRLPQAGPFGPPEVGQNFLMVFT